MASRSAKLVLTSARLFADDVAALKRLAVEKRSKWQIELRQLVHRALADAKRVSELLRHDA